MPDCCLLKIIFFNWKLLKVGRDAQSDKKPKKRQNPKRKFIPEIHLQSKPKVLKKRNFFSGKIIENIFQLPKEAKNIAFFNSLSSNPN